MAPNKKLDAIRPTTTALMDTCGTIEVTTNKNIVVVQQQLYLS